MNRLLFNRQAVIRCLFLLPLLFVCFYASSQAQHTLQTNQKIYIHFVGDSITKGMLNNSYLNGGKISEYGGYRGELFQYLRSIATEAAKKGWPKITEDNTTQQLFIQDDNSHEYQLTTLGAGIVPTAKIGPYQIHCGDINYLICNNPDEYAHNDGRSGETSAQVLGALATGEWPLLPFFEKYQINQNSKLLTTILLGTNDLLQKNNPAETVANIEKIVNATVAELQPKITDFAFVISTIPDAEVYANADVNIHIKTLNDKINALVTKLAAKNWGTLQGKIAFFKVDQHFIKTPKNDPDVRHLDEEGWGSVHPSYFQYKVMACNLLFANHFSASAITPETKYTNLPLTYPKDTPFELVSKENFDPTKYPQGACIEPASPQGFMAALKFLADGKDIPVQDSISWDTPNLTIDAITSDNIVSGSFQPATIKPNLDRVKPEYRCVVENKEIPCNLDKHNENRFRFTLDDLSPKNDKVISITAYHPQYPNISQTHSITIPWPSEPQLLWTNADLRIENFDIENKTAKISFNPACITTKDEPQQCLSNKVQYRCTTSDKQVICQFSADENKRKVVSLSNLNEDSTTVNIEAHNQAETLKTTKSIILEKHKPATVTLRCPTTVTQGSMLEDKDYKAKTATEYMLLKVASPTECHFSKTTLSCIIPDPGWPKLLCYNPDADKGNGEAYQAAGRLSTQPAYDCTTTGAGTFSGSNCDLSW